MTERYSEIKSLINQALTLLEKEIDEIKRDNNASFNRLKESMIQEIKERDLIIETLKKQLAELSQQNQTIPKRTLQERHLSKQTQSEESLFSDNIFNEHPTQDEGLTKDDNRKEAQEDEFLIDDEDIFSIDDEDSGLFEIIDKGKDTKATILGELFSTKGILGQGAQSYPNWYTDRTGEKVAHLDDAISLNDRVYFTRELFGGDSEQLELTLERINDSDSFTDVISEMRATFPEWDEDSDAVYRFYMAVRRKF